MKLIKLLITLCLLFSLVACSNQESPKPLTNVEKSEETLMGTYKATSQIGDVTITFRDDNTVNYTVSALSDKEQIEGSYTLEGDKLIIKNHEGDSIEANYNKDDDSITIEDLQLAYNK